MVKNDFCNSGTYVPPPGKVALGAMFRWFGHQYTTSQNYFYDGMKRGTRELAFWQYTISGCGMVEIGGEKLPVRPGEAFLLTAPEKHLYYLPAEPGKWEFLYLTLEGCETMRIVRQLRRMLPPVSKAYAAPRAVELAWELIRKGKENDFATPLDASETVYAFLMALAGGSTDGRESSGNDLVLKVHNYCLQHLAEDIEVDMMAEFAGYSRSHFCRIFRGLSGKAPHEYLLELRVRTAIRMLQNSNASVKEIADGCGFAETGYFCKVFRRFTGTTPGAFRRKG